MLHDGITARRSNTSSTTERRGGPRVPYPAELVLAWHCSMPETSRYPIVDVSDNGFRIRSTVPLVTGMTGTAISMLPEGQKLGHSVAVVWCRKVNDNDEFDVGLRRL